MSNGWLRGSEYEAYSDAAIDYGDIRQLSSFMPPEPNYPEIELQGQERNRLTRVYGAIHLNFTDRLKGVAGASAVWLKTSGFSYGSDLARDDHKVSPYAGLLFDLTSNLTLYASYTDIYAPQTQVNIDNSRLNPAKGTSIEGGIKGSWLDNRLTATAALFKAKQRGLASYVGTFDGTDGPLGLDYYEGVDTTSQGFEVARKHEAVHVASDTAARELVAALRTGDAATALETSRAFHQACHAAASRIWQLMSDR